MTQPAIVAGEGTYISHREIIREDHLSTKLRVVLDCSAKCDSNISLNESLEKGPCLNPQSLDLFIKCRLYPITITGDTEKVYFQINVHKSHGDYLRFLWFSDINTENPVIERCRFGTLQPALDATIRKHASKYEKVDAEFARKSRNHFYADDLNSGAYNVKDGFDLYKKLKLI